MKISEYNPSSISNNTSQIMSEVRNHIAHLLKLSQDPLSYGELISMLDPTVDKIEHHIITLHAKLTEEADRRVREFESAIIALDSLATMSKSNPPGFLSDTDKAKWHELAMPGVSKQMLMNFKSTLVAGFKKNIYKQLQIDELTDQNVAIRNILYMIRKELII